MNFELLLPVLVHSYYEIKQNDNINNKNNNKNKNDDHDEELEANIGRTPA